MLIIHFLNIEGYLLNNNKFCYNLAHQLLYTHRIFGDENKLIVGNAVELNDALINTSSGKVIIGDYSFCGHNVFLLTGAHAIEQKNYKRIISIPSKGRDIIIGRGVWLASNVTVCAPCIIGDHAVIGAGAVVSGEVPAGAFMAGVPAKIVKMIKFDGE